MTAWVKSVHRREFLGTAAVGLVGAAQPAQPVPTRQLTRGPRFHWFGYYDKLEFDPTGRYVLGMEVDFEHRSPRPEDRIALGMVDLKNGDRWIELSHSTAWCWQQGCMLQWLPGSPDRVIFNDRADPGAEHPYVSRILNTRTGRLVTLPRPIYAVNARGTEAIAPDFRRLAHLRPGYGYNGAPDPHEKEERPTQSGIWSLSLTTGASRLLFSVADIANQGPELPTMRNTRHWFNHLLYNPSGTRFVFLHRWQVGNSRQTRMVTAAADGSDVRFVDVNGLTSHFIWRDDTHLLAWSGYGKKPGFYLFQDLPGGGQVKAIGAGVMLADGHCTYLPSGKHMPRWILCDTYPNQTRHQAPYLFDLTTGQRTDLGAFLSPPAYTGEWRCDTHPRFSPDGKSAVIDSPAPRGGRQLHLLDLSGVVGRS